MENFQEKKPIVRWNIIRRSVKVKSSGKIFFLAVTGQPSFDPINDLWNKHEKIRKRKKRKEKGQKTRIEEDLLLWKKSVQLGENRFLED
jgi:hypothetical protein